MRTSATIAIPPFAPASSTCCVSDVLGARLDRLVDREHDVGPALGGLDDVGAARDLVALRVALDARLARAAAQALLVERLEAGEPVVVGADEAEHGRGEQARRVEALRLRDVGEAVQAQLLDPRHGGVVHLARHVREPALRLRQLRLELGLVRRRRPARAWPRTPPGRGSRAGRRRSSSAAPRARGRRRCDRRCCRARQGGSPSARVARRPATADASGRAPGARRGARRSRGTRASSLRRGWSAGAGWVGVAHPGAGGSWRAPRCGFTFFQSPSVVVVSPPTDGASRRARDLQIRRRIVRHDETEPLRLLDDSLR